MTKRPTLSDVARAAGVGVATVDRMVNGRARVSEATARKIAEAAAAIGYHGAPLLRDRALPDLPEYRLGIVLQKERHAFYQDLAQHLQEAARRDPAHRWRATVRFVSGQAPSDYAQAIIGMAGKVQAVAATGIDHPDVTHAVAALRERGIPVAALLSDFAQGARETYVGTNNLKTGRTAGWLMHHIARPAGKLSVFIGGHRFHGHDLRETGFRSFIRECAGGFELLEAMINLETRALTYEATLDLAGRHPDLVGIYCAGGGMEGAIAAVRELRAKRRLVLIVHELTPESRQGLIDGSVAVALATPLAQVAAEALAALGSSLAGQPSSAGQVFVSPSIVTPENV